MEKRKSPIFPIAVILALVVIVIFWLRGTSPAHFDVPTPTAPSGPNAFVDFARAASLEQDATMIDTSIPSSDPARYDYSLPSLASGVSAEQIRQMAADNAPALAALRAGFTHPYFAPPLRSTSQFFPYLAQDRALARFCRFEAIAAAQIGNWGESERVSLDAVQLGAQISQHAVFIQELVSIACGAIGRRNAFAAIDHLDSTTARQDAKRLEQIGAIQESPVQTLMEERWFEEAAMNPILGRSGNVAEAIAEMSSGSSAHRSSGEKAAFLAESAAFYIRYPKQQIARSYTQYMDAELRKWSLPYSVARRTPDPPLPSDPINSVLLPLFGGVRFKGTYNQTFNTLLMTMLALRAYKLDHQNRYPPMLADLAPSYLARVPLDRSPTTRRCGTTQLTAASHTCSTASGRTV